MSIKRIILISVFIAGLCSIVYELLVSTAATYFLGNSVKQFSVIIGIYLFAMGVGAYISKFYQKKSLHFFIGVEFILGIIGGLSVPFMYFMFIQLSPDQMQFATWVLIFTIGLFTGMEVPLLAFSVDDGENLKDSFSDVLSIDYIGGLIATLLFPFLLLPFIGLYYSSLLFGSINIGLGILLALKLKTENKRLLLGGFLSLAILGYFFVTGNHWLHLWDTKIYKAPIVLKEQTPHQLIVVTKKKEDVRLYLNRVIQFSSKDEYRYHETLVHPVLSIHGKPKRVLVLGGGENLASREILKNQQVEQIDVVDLDSTIFHLAKTHPDFLRINEGAAKNARVNLHATDAFNFLSSCTNLYDIIISDLPDPNSEATAKLYTKQFFMMAKMCLKPDGIFITQAGEIYFSNTAFSCISITMNEVFNYTTPMHVYIPSFGDWGFLIGSHAEINPSFKKLEKPSELKFLDKNAYTQVFNMPKDIGISSTKINTLDHPIILNYFLSDWKKWRPDLLKSTN